MVTGNYYDRYNIRKKYRKNQTFIEVILNNNYHYYRNLSPKGKNKFLARLCKVLNKAEFVGYQGLEITEEIKICVIFSKIQLTYGLNLFRFKRFRKYILAILIGLPTWYVIGILVAFSNNFGTEFGISEEVLPKKATML